MRGAFVDQGRLFSYISPEARVPANHPLRKVRELLREVLRELNRSLSKLYASEGRPSIPPEQLLSALLLQVFYGIRSERQLMEQLDYNLLYRWFVGLSPDDPVWDPTTFTKNRDGLAREKWRDFLIALDACRPEAHRRGHLAPYRRSHRHHRPRRVRQLFRKRRIRFCQNMKRSRMDGNRPVRSHRILMMHF
jgi:transposase